LRNRQRELEGGRSERRSDPVRNLDDTGGAGAAGVHATELAGEKTGPPDSAATVAVTMP
jgi:hypothetical protein